ncbi:hypothetical protein [Hymenobacter sp. IS2118]|uniref:hypothetical protein n=1 Tax=Hymenobacter sp. IS2118 TaxID=1505605 RepID=UPI000555A3D3|nr:hypothetical protein [Hymenobacter sp. IS2118]
MKKVSTFLLSLLLVALTFAAAQAQTIRRCNNVGVTGAGVFATLQAAHDAAASGDIIYLEPSSLSYGSLICVKPLTIIGNGYLHSEQSTLLTVDPRPSMTATVRFEAGSAGSRITGVTVGSLLMVNADNIVVERNRLQSSGLFIGGNIITGAAAVINTGIIRQNLMDGLGFSVSAASPVSGVLIDNNIIIGNISNGNSPNVNGVLISNNVLGNRAGNGGGAISIDNSVLKNNIITNAAAAVAPNSNAFSNNLSTGTQFGTINGNQQNVALGSIFGSATGTETQFQIAVGGPADNTGESGVDCGAFGAARPYILTGLPAVPTIFEYAQSISGATLNATISTRSNK